MIGLSVLWRDGYEGHIRVCPECHKVIKECSQPTDFNMTTDCDLTQLQHNHQL